MNDPSYLPWVRHPNTPITVQHGWLAGRQPCGDWAVLLASGRRVALPGLLVQHREQLGRVMPYVPGDIPGGVHPGMRVRVYFAGEAPQDLLLHNGWVLPGWRWARRWWWRLGWRPRAARPHR